jgi:hypothetical protein
MPSLMNSPDEPLNCIEVAVRQAGGVRRCAQLLKVSQRSIYHWMRRGHLRGVATERVLLLERESGIQAELLVGWRMRGETPCREN